MSESPAEFLERERRDEPHAKSVRDRGSDGPCRDPRATAQPDTPDLPYGDG